MSVKVVMALFFCFCLIGMITAMVATAQNSQVCQKKVLKKTKR